jgi:iron complex transport system ATP-binding protein
MTIVADNLIWKIGRKTIVDGVSFAARPGKVLGLLGPNGSGKTSLLRLIAGLKRPWSGRVLLDQTDLSTIARRAVAQRVAFVEQHAATNASLRVIDVIKLGRFPHRSMFSGWSSADDLAVETAIERTGLKDKQNERWQTLSGGEKQRAHIARALAQSPKELILDEPTNHLDIQHQMSLLKLITSLPVTSIVALHDLNHAATFCDDLLVMQTGKVVAFGSPEKVISEHLLKEVFRVDARVEISRYSARPHIHYLK